MRGEVSGSTGVLVPDGWADLARVLSLDGYSAGVRGEVSGSTV